MKTFEQVFDPQIDIALELREAGRLKESLSLLSSFVGDIPKNDVRCLSIVGALFLEGKDYINAFVCYKKAVDSAPESDSASIGLFHSLWGLGREKEAFAELKRFLSISQSEEHFRLIEEMRDAAILAEKEEDDSKNDRVE